MREPYPPGRRRGFSRESEHRAWLAGSRGSTCTLVRFRASRRIGILLLTIVLAAATVWYAKSAKDQVE
jgi:hypothetical protein